MEKKEQLQGLVRSALVRAETFCARYRPWDTRLPVVGIICGALATLLAGGTVAGGANAATVVFGGWRILCAIVALLTAAGTVAGTLHRSLQVTSKVVTSEKCIGGLRALEASLAASDVASEDALATFQRISEEYAVCLA